LADAYMEIKFISDEKVKHKNHTNQINQSSRKKEKENNNTISWQDY
jgi:hypothetical protein